MKHATAFDIVVVGAGHAGVEAAAAAARRGARVALVTFCREDLGQMSCNPSIGGVGKGHLVREVDVFDGLIGRAADAAAIHRRMLNRSKGPAVWGPRVQADRARFAQVVRTLLGERPITVVEGEVVGIRLAGGRVSAVELKDDYSLTCSAAILATGTFLDGRLFLGHETVRGGRLNNRAATKIARQLRDVGLGQGRLKTGTPPRLDGRTIDWAVTEDQPSDAESWWLSALPSIPPPQLRCAITRTSPETHALLRANFDRSPLYAGAIGGRGPRYCPSIEDKVRRFSDKDSHQIFLEPEALGSSVVYPNGLSTSMPRDVQEEMIRSIRGLERAQITQPGYAVEYEFVDARKLDGGLGVRDIPGLFLAGQINGTTGYEEAAAQGLVAGLNAAALALDLPEIRFDRGTSYIGVMIDDLTLQGVSEPYRMLTARAENRLFLRADNATTRLGLTALETNCVGPVRKAAIERHFEKRGRGDWCETEEGRADAIYAPYLQRNQREWDRLREERALPIPAEFDFTSVPGLSSEMIERLATAGPDCLDQARRVSGVTPAALSALYIAIKRESPA